MAAVSLVFLSCFFVWFVLFWSWFRGVRLPAWPRPCRSCGSFRGGVSCPFLLARSVSFRPARSSRLAVVRVVFPWPLLGGGRWSARPCLPVPCAGVCGRRPGRSPAPSWLLVSRPRRLRPRLRPRGLAGSGSRSPCAGSLACPARCGVCPFPCPRRLCCRPWPRLCRFSRRAWGGFVARSLRRAFSSAWAAFRLPGSLGPRLWGAAGVLLPLPLVFAVGRAVRRAALRWRLLRRRAVRAWLSVPLRWRRRLLVAWSGWLGELAFWAFGLAFLVGVVWLGGVR